MTSPTEDIVAALKSQDFGADKLRPWKEQSLYGRFCEAASSGIFVAMILSVQLGILFRQVDFGFSRAMQLSVSLANIALIWSMFLGMGLVDIERTHIRVDFLYERMGPRTQAAINMVGNVLFAVTFVLVIPGAIRFAEAAGFRTLVGSPITYQEIFSIFIYWFAITAINQVFDFYRNWQVLRGRKPGLEDHIEGAPL
ncbi:MAG: TRAP transporter small permease subunit [Rhodobacteraceae bacterium]|nr:MAG: TRAP transporter small permease subunit [Paracoccaceae bacterium]